MALKTYIRLSDGVQVTVDDSFLTERLKSKFGTPVKPEVPEAIKTKKKKHESN